MVLVARLDTEDTNNRAVPCAEDCTIDDPATFYESYTPTQDEEPLDSSRLDNSRLEYGRLRLDSARPLDAGTLTYPYHRQDSYSHSRHGSAPHSRKESYAYSSRKGSSRKESHNYSRDHSHTHTQTGSYSYGNPADKGYPDCLSDQNDGYLNYMAQFYRSIFATTQEHFPKGDLSVCERGVIDSRINLFCVCLSTLR